MQAIPGAVPVTVSALPLAIWSSDFRVASQTEPAKPVFAPVFGAYVACIRIRGGWPGAFSEVQRLRLGRTNNFGWVMHRERGALGGEREAPRAEWRSEAELPTGGAPHEEDYVDPEDAGVSRPTSLEMFDDPELVMVSIDTGQADAEVLYVLPNETYRIHWCYDRALFDQFLERYDADPETAFDEYQVREYVVAPFSSTSAQPYFRELQPTERGWVARQLSTGCEGYHAGWPGANAIAGAIFDGTPRALRTLLLCEWLHDSCVRMVQQDTDWAHLNTLRGVIAAAGEGAVIQDLAKALPSDERACEAHEMRTYLFWLAWSGLRDRGVVVSLVDVARLKRTTDWKICATGLANDPKYGACPHPALHPKTVEGRTSNYVFSADEQAALVAYYDMYALGLDFASEKEHVEQQWPKVVERANWVLANAQKRLKVVSLLDLMRAGATQIPKSSARSDISTRYFRACAQLDVRFWKHPEVATSRQSFWDAQKPFLVWLAEDSGLLADVLVRALEPHLRSYREVTASELESIVQYFFRYHLTLTDQPVTRQLPELDANLKLEKIGQGDEVMATVTTHRGTHQLARLQLLTRHDPTVKDRVFAPVGRPFSKQHVSRFEKAAEKATRKFIAREKSVRLPDTDALEAFPKQLALFASAIKTSIALKALVDAPPSTDAAPGGNFELWVNLTQEVLAAVGPTTELLAHARDGKQFRGANEWLVRGGGRFVKAGLLVESLHGILTGATTLATLLPDATREALGVHKTSDLGRYLRDHQSFAALVETTKGLVQVGVGASQLAVVGGATTLAAVPLSQVVAVGLTAVAMMDVIIYLDTGGPSPVQAFKDGARGALQKQLYTASGPANDHACLLARRLGALNQLAKTA